jgi:TonB family protein
MRIFTKQATLALAGLAFLVRVGHAEAFPFLLIVPIPKVSVDPDKVDATPQQRHFAQCAAFHRDVVDPDITGKRETSFHADVIRMSIERLSGFADAKKLVGAYANQWQRQAKVNYQTGQDYAKMLMRGCVSANLPVAQAQYDYWQAEIAGHPGSNPDLADIPAMPIKPLESLISPGDYPAGVARRNGGYTVSLDLQVDRHGKVSDCYVEETSGSDTLDSATCALLRERAQFRPGYVDGMVAVRDVKYRQIWGA